MDVGEGGQISDFWKWAEGRFTQAPGKLYYYPLPNENIRRLVTISEIQEVWIAAQTSLLEELKESYSRSERAAEIQEELELLNPPLQSPLTCPN